MFDEKTIQNLKYYVYMLIEPVSKTAFYIGKGVGNRVFNHLECALSESTINEKYEKIREILSNNLKVEHVIVRHGLSEKEALQIEASLIDAFNYSGILLTNIVNGHYSIEKGIMNSEEIKRLYNAEELNYIDKDCIIININKKYKKAESGDSIYKATKEIWTIKKTNIPKIRYVLSEYHGLIVEVFEVKEWYEKERGFNPNAKQYGNNKIGYGFDGVVADKEIRDLYINKSIKHLKKKGAANSIRYNLT